MHVATKENVKKRLPGFILAVGVAIIAKSVALIFPQVGGATLAILIGILLGNSCFRQPLFAAGTKFSESRLLEYSVVLLGFTVTIQTIAEIGIRGMTYILCMMLIVISSTYLIGKKLGFNQKMALMMAGGNAICGSSAIGSIAPAIRADEEEKGQIITLVNLLGTVMMLTLPFLGMYVFPKNLIAQSALIGGTLQSVGQVVAGASLIDPSVVQFAMLFKILRIFMLVAVVFVFERMVNEKSDSISKGGVKRKGIIPWYILGFVLCCLVSSFVELPPIIHQMATTISTWFETTALAAIGLRLDLRKFLKEGPKFLLYGLSVGTIQTLAAILLINLI